MTAILDTAYGVSLRSANVSSGMLSLGDSFTVSWEVSFSSPSGIYTLEAYLSPTPNVPTPKANYRLFTKNRGNSPLYSCQAKGSNTCSYVSKLSGAPVFDCGLLQKSVPFTGSGYLVLRACIYNEKLEYVCDKKSVPVTVN
ncbi:hypothetical protein [Hydrogenivirga sp.]